ncbi:uncharacterized protein LOC116348703, partial [Contarinia nasturtii]|uniref:uncharacterized protein LOC116348703 n=1 Tax=Contarinia nasturtii TaxID=265458 RepID=UPI0012D3973B
MGSSISCIIAEILMDWVLDQAINKVKESLNYDIKTIKKYVDDIWLALPERMANGILDVFNSVCKSIQFTMESEQNGQLPFLDTLTIHNLDGSISTEWYIKPIASGRVLNLNSFHPLNNKISTAVGLIDRVCKLSSNKTQKDLKDVIFTILSRNNYPRPLINGIFNKYNSNNNRTTTTNATPVMTSSNITQFYSLEYINGISEHISKLISTYMDCRISFHTSKKVAALFSNVKDKIPIRSQSKLIYAIKCLDCRDKEYIGNTAQWLSKRLRQHELTVVNNERYKSALAQHAIDNNHRFDFDNAKVLAKCSNMSKRFYIEELYIKNSKNCVNIRSLESSNVGV